MTEQSHNIPTTVTVVNEQAIPKAIPKDRKRLKHSNFFGTINTQQRFTGHEQEYAEYVKKFTDVIAKMLSPQNLHKIIIIRKDGQAFSKKYIKSIDIQYAVELGPKNNTVHCHFLINIDHWSSVQLNIEEINREVCGGMGLENCYINVKAYASAQQTLEEYIRKTNQK